MVFDEDLEDPRCPECGGPIGPTATYCMHCSSDLAEKQPVAPEEAPLEGSDTGDEFVSVSTASSSPVDHPLDPEGIMDNTLTVIVGIAGGLIIGIVGTFVLLFLTESVWAIPVGLVGWLGATAYLVRRRYLMDAVAKTAYGIAAVFLSVPLVAVVFEGGLLERGSTFLVLFLVVGVPAGIATAIGWFASRYVPEDTTGV